MKRAVYKTLGCKLNQADTEQIAEMLKEKGIAEICSCKDGDPELVLVNTCAVTQKAEAKSRHAISKATRENPEAIVIAAGCLAQLCPESLLKIDGVDYILGTSTRFSTEWWRGRTNEPIIEIDHDLNRFRPGAGLKNSNRSRPFLKIQDGCDQDCSYCIIPSLRGRNRSVGREIVLNSAGNLISAGACEIVLTGVRIGSWGTDIDERDSLTGLIREITGIPGNFRIRLGSIEPWELCDDLLDLVVNNEKVCSHLHVPIQHTSTRILGAMNRPVVDDALKLLTHVRRDNPDMALGIDLIAGFPGESEDDFLDLIDTIVELPITYLHAFGFSPRPGTPAAEMKNQVKSLDIKERIKELIEVGVRKKKSFVSSQVGRILTVIPDRDGTENQWTNTVSDNYLKLLVKSNKLIKSKAFRVRLSIDNELGTVGQMK